VPRGVLRGQTHLSLLSYLRDPRERRGLATSLPQRLSQRQPQRQKKERETCGGLLRLVAPRRRRNARSAHSPGSRGLLAKIRSLRSLVMFFRMVCRDAAVDRGMKRIKGSACAAVTFPPERSDRVLSREAPTSGDPLGGACAAPRRSKATRLFLS
jgi:hypothetical protein